MPWRWDKLPTPVFSGFLGGSDSKESACNVGDLGSIPGHGSSPGEGNSYPLQYSGLENSMDRGAWQVTVHRVTKNRTQLSNFHFQVRQRKINIIWYHLFVESFKMIQMNLFTKQKQTHRHKKTILQLWKGKRWGRGKLGVLH